VSAERASLCHDCRDDTTPCTGRRGCRHRGRWEWYGVHDHVWAAAGDVSGYLCVGCLERRLRRQLVPEDFAPWPINRPHPWDTDRLAARKAGSAGSRN
jgi:hypothetical protein